MDPALELLARLGDDLGRARRLTVEWIPAKLAPSSRASEVDIERLWPEVVRLLEASPAKLFLPGQRELGRLVYQAFTEAFIAGQLALEVFVECISFGDRGPIQIRRRGGELTVFADPGAGRDAWLEFAEELGRRDRTLRIAAELLGVLLAVTASWSSTTLTPPIVLRSMAKAVPRVVRLGRELGSLWAPKLEAALTS